MGNINEFLEKEVKIKGDTNFNTSLFNQYCNKFNFSTCSKISVSLTTDLSDLYYLLENLYLVQDNTGYKYYISNTCYSNEDVFRTLIKYNLISFVRILGEGFWGSETTAVMLDYYKINDIINGVNENPDYLKYNTTKFDDYMKILKQLDLEDGIG